LLDVPLLDRALLDVPLLDMPLLDRALLDAFLLDAPLLDVLLAHLALMHAFLLHVPLAHVVLLHVLLLDTLLFHVALIGKRNSRGRTPVIDGVGRVVIPHAALVATPLGRRIRLGLRVASPAETLASVAFSLRVDVAPRAALVIPRFEAAVAMVAGRFAVVPVLNDAPRLLVAVPVQVIIVSSLAQEGAQAAVMAGSCLRGARG